MPVHEIHDLALMLSDDSSVRFYYEVSNRGGMPVITARQAASVIHSLLDNRPFAVGCDDERVEINLKPVSNRIVINSRREAAGPDQRLTVKTSPIGNRAQFIRRLKRLPARTAANVGAAIIRAAWQSVL